MPNPTNEQTYRVDAIELEPDVMSKSKFAKAIRIGATTNPVSM